MSLGESIKSSTKQTITRTANAPSTRALAASAALLMGLAFSAGARAECADNWQDCKGKPWVDGDTMETPLGSKWWPNVLWGEGDEAGSTNWYTKPEVVKRALSQASEGKVFRLGHDYTSKMPLFGERKFTLRIPAGPTGGPFGENKIVWYDDFLATEIGQVGTQFDGLGHIGVQIGVDGNRAEMRFYNGVTSLDMGTPYGLTKLGVEKLHPIIARGVLIDLVAVKGGDGMNAGECFTMDDVNAALEKQGMQDFDFTSGDALLFRTGWERLWNDAPAYNAGQPGMCMDVARWVAEEVQAGVTGGDSWAATDPVPYPDEPGCAFCVHQYLQTRHGIVNQENLALKQLADAGVYVFLYQYAAAPIAGATGSMGTPVAIK